MVTIREDDGEYKLEEITPAEAAKLQKIGRAEGHDFNHCVFLALRNAKGLAKKCKGYVMVPPEQAGMRTAVEFFGAKA